MGGINNNLHNEHLVIGHIVVAPKRCNLFVPCRVTVIDSHLQYAIACRLRCCYY